jgi:hypothetical protein
LFKSHCNPTCDPTQAGRSWRFEVHGL